MLKTCLLSLSLVFVAASAVPARAQAQGGAASTTLTNASVVKLVRAGFREKTVIAIIAARPVNFDLTPERLIELKRGGVSERVILAMLARAEAVEFASDDWDDMPLDGDSGASKSPGASSDPGSVNIFGSSGGALSGISPCKMRCAFCTMRLSPAWRNTSLSRTTVTAAEAMMSART